MKTQKLDTMKKTPRALRACGLAAIAVAAALMSGCTTTGELEAVRAQRDIAIAVIKENAAAADRAAVRRADLAIEREKRLAAEAEAKRTKAHVAYLIADKADAGGKAAIATTLALAQDAPAPALDLDRVAPMPAPMQVPVIAAPKSGWDKFMDGVDRGLAVLDRGIRVWSINKAAQTQVDITRLQEDGNTARSGQMWGGLGRMSDNQTNLGIAAVNAQAAGNAGSMQSIEHMVAELTKHPTIQVSGSSETNIAVGGSSVAVAKCPQQVAGTGGDAGNGAPGGNGGNGGGATSPGGTAGNGAPGGASGPVSQTVSQNCQAGK